MAQEITVAREGGVESLNGVSSGGRQTPRLYGTADTERYPKSVSLGISTRDGSARKDKAILESVQGQLSDGMWENSRGMEKYWHSMDFSQNDKGGVELRYANFYKERKYGYTSPRNYYGARGMGGSFSYDVTKASGFIGKSDREIRNWLAGKIKAIVDQERKDYPSTGKWNATNQSELQYMRDGVTVADAYSLYKRLKG